MISNILAIIYISTHIILKNNDNFNKFGIILFESLKKVSNESSSLLFFSVVSAKLKFLFIILLLETIFPFLSLFKNSKELPFNDSFKSSFKLFLLKRTLLLSFFL